MTNLDEKRQRFELFLKQIQLPFELHETYFSSVELVKVLCHAQNNHWTFILSSGNFLPLDVIRTFQALANNKFKDMVSIDFIIRYDETITNSRLCDEYWDLCVEQLKRSQPSINGILNRAQISTTNQKLIVGLIDEISLKIADEKNIADLIHHFFETKFERAMNVQLTVSDHGREEIEKFSQKVEQEQQIFVEQTKQVTLPLTEKIEKIEGAGPLLYGYEIKDNPVPLEQIKDEEKKVTVRGTVFGFTESVTKNGTTILQFYLTDFTDSIQVKLFVKTKEDVRTLKALSNDMWVLARGKVEYDRFGNSPSPELVFTPNDIQEILPLQEREDDATEKRVEFHLHTAMSAMDGINHIEEIIKTAKKWGHKALAITDHAVVHAYPEAEKFAKDSGVKIIYGLEANVINEPYPVVVNPTDTDLYDQTYVVFDIETTSLTVAAGEIIEIAGVKMRKGEIIDTFSSLIKSELPIPEKITQITNITNEMVENSPTIAQILPNFMSFVGDAVLVAHNARFDLGFIQHWCARLGLQAPVGAVVDTLEMARLLLAKEMKLFNLQTLAERFRVDLKSHHRALDDCTATGHIFFHLLAVADKNGLKTFLDLNKNATSRLIHVRPFHCCIYALNATGKKNLYKLVSISHTEHFRKVACIPKHKLNEYREGLLIASGCEKGEFFEAVLYKSLDEAERIAHYYDVLEVQPLTAYRHLVDKGLIGSESEIVEAIKRIIQIGKKLDKPVIATGNVHYLHPHQKINRDIIINGIVSYTPLRDMEKPDVHYRTTNEMLDEFRFLEDSTAYEIVVKNTAQLADRFESYKLFPKELFAPHIPGAEEEIRNTCYETARHMYGEPLPEIVVKRLEKELTPIINYGFSANYLISQRLVKKSNEAGFLVGSRGSVGSSIVAMMLGISEVNPLPPHYVCPSCKHSEWYEDGSVANGFDLKDKSCPACGSKMSGQGHDIPFETFLGFKGDKVPDIDLNFSGSYQSHAHNYTRDMFGEKNVFRAGTVGTIKDRTAFGYVKKYFEGKHLNPRNAEVQRLALGCTGVKKSSGQHPGGIIVVPDHMEIEEITPVQFPADAESAEWKTTHFDYHSFEANLLKLDILGHDDPTMMHMLYELTGKDPITIPMNDPNVMKLFSSTEPLNVSSDAIRSNVGTYGVPEMGTKFVRQMLEETNPTTFSDLLQISGLSHGTDVWLGNAQELIKSKTCTIKTVIGCRDEIMLYLIYKAGMEASLAFTITESVRKGKGLKDEWIEDMKKHKVPDWYIQSCLKIKYMFPKAHAAAYVISAVRTAFYKIYYPIEFYAAYFSIRVSDFDISLFREGYKAIAKRHEELAPTVNSMTAKDREMYQALEMALEMTARGYSFKSIDIHVSHSRKFLIQGKSLLPPFCAISGCGESVAQSIEIARQDGEFLSIEDFQSRSKCSKTVIDTMREMGCFAGMPENNQMSLFDY